MLRGLARRRVRATWDYWRYVYGSEWKYILGLVGVVLGFVVSVLPTSWVLWVTIIGAVLTILLWLIDTRELRSRWVGVLLVNNRGDIQSYPFEGVQWDADRGLSGFVTLASSDPQTPGERIWRDPELNRALWTQSRATGIDLRPRPYELPPELRDIAPQALRRTSRPNESPTERTKRPVWFNGRLARLATEPTVERLGTTVFEFEEVSYFDGQASNELWHWSRDVSIPDGGNRIPLLCAVDTRRRILPLDQSRMAHIVGITIFAITSDDQLIFVKQSRHNSVQPDGFAASASGSLDWADVRQCEGNLFDALMTGMMRELDEESCVQASDVIPGSARITGYFRWLSRGTKTEFSGLVRLRVTAEELLSRRISGEEKTYTSGHGVVPLSLLLADRGELGWEAPVDDLQAALGGGAGLVLGTSTMATWHAAADYLEANPEYLSTVDFEPAGFTDAGAATRAGKGDEKLNEDFGQAGPRGLVVVDGATGLGGEPVMHDVSDARWFARRVGQQLFDGLQREAPLSHILAEVIAEAGREYDEVGADRDPVDRPVASLAAVRIVEDRLEWLNVADCPIVVLRDEGHEVIVDGALAPLDRAAVQQMVHIARAEGISVRDARPQISELLRSNRARQNQPGGYCAVDTQGLGLAGVHTGSVPLAGLRGVVVMSDGFEQIHDPQGMVADLGELAADVHADTVDEWMDRLFAAEDADPDFEQHPRFKLHDDTTVAWGWFRR